MSTTLAVAALLATVLACISFLAGTTYTDSARDRAYRQLVKQRRELNEMLLPSADSYTTACPHSPSYELFHPGMGRQATLLQPYDHDLDDD